VFLGIGGLHVAVDAQLDKNLDMLMDKHIRIGMHKVKAKHVDVYMTKASTNTDMKILLDIVVGCVTIKFFYAVVRTRLLIAP